MLAPRVAMDKAITNDQWMTEDVVPDPAPLPRIPGVGILVRPVQTRKKSAGGILIPESVRSDMEYLTTVGRVLSLGELAFVDEDIYRNGPWVKPGDYVVYAKYAGSKIWWKGVKLLLIKAAAIELVVDKPEWLDSNFKE
jgi:co-chaperonin GroES (HSP10)